MKKIIAYELADLAGMAGVAGMAGMAGQGVALASLCGLSARREFGGHFILKTSVGVFEPGVGADGGLGHAGAGGGRAHMGYIRKFLEIVGRLRAERPKLVLECCSGGGFRFDAETQSHFDISFFSDSVNPFDVLRIGEGAALRALPGRVMRWCCFEKAESMPKYGSARRDAAVLAPKGAVWDEAERVDPGFALKVCMQGHLSFSGELAGLDAATKAEAKKAVEFAKAHRELVYNGVCHPLTPIAGIGDRGGWSAALIWDGQDGQDGRGGGGERGSATREAGVPPHGRSPAMQGQCAAAQGAGAAAQGLPGYAGQRGALGILYAYRLDSHAGSMPLRFPAGCVRENLEYSVRDYDSGETARISGKELMREGLPVAIADRFRASIKIIYAREYNRPPSAN
ncbi:MAG: alpha-galactosidase [Clostridiales bacterium]|jgi:hypothetical protein|nr:alpha-galactosidase [Clostridiales bacterium]